MTFNLFPLYGTCSAQATLHWYSSLALFSSNKNREGESLFFFQQLFVFILNYFITSLSFAQLKHRGISYWCILSCITSRAKWDLPIYFWKTNWPNVLFWLSTPSAGGIYAVPSAFLAPCR